MDFEDEENFILSLLLVKRLRKNRKRRYWVHPYIIRNIKYSAAIVGRELRQSPEKFQKFYRMSKSSFDFLLELVSPIITKNDTNYRKAIPASERLLITLRYLATGSSHTTLSFTFMRGRSTIGKIISETTKAIWEVLYPLYMPPPTKEIWLNVAKRYNELCKLPHCIGSIDGKHIRIKKFAGSGSLYFNYKGFFSVVLLAVTDADGFFITIDVGEIGRNSDGGVFNNSNIKRGLENGTLNVPEKTLLEGDGLFPYFLVGDEAFPLKEYLLRPFSKRTLTNTKRIFNYRLSKGRKSVECAFGMLVSKYRIFETPIWCKESTVNFIIKSACVLHNFVKSREGILSNFSEDQQITSPEASVLPLSITERGLTRSEIIRNRLANFFIRPENALPWQWNYCVNE